MDRFDECARLIASGEETDYYAAMVRAGFGESFARGYSHRWPELYAFRCAGAGVTPLTMPPSSGQQQQAAAPVDEVVVVEGGEVVGRYRRPEEAVEPPPADPVSEVPPVAPRRPRGRPRKAR